MSDEIGDDAASERALTPRRLWLTAFVAALLLLPLTISGCGSLKKREIATRLAALDKNAAVEPTDIRTRDVAFEIGAGSSRARATYLHPRRAEDPREDARPVVLVHGTPSSMYSWVDVVYGGDDWQGLAARHDVYALEVVDHGIAPAADGRASFQRCADWVVAFLESLGVGPVVLVGQSYGGEFAWRAALDRPDLVSHLVLLDSSGYPRPDDGWLPEEKAMRQIPGARWGWLLNSRDRIETALSPHFRELGDDRVEEIYLLCANAANWGAMVDLARDENGTRADEIADIETPTLLIWGEDDIAYDVDEVARRFASDLPDARLHVVEACGHYPQEERPAAVVAAILAFLED